MPDVKIVKHAGFCFGVRRAIEMLEKTIARGVETGRNVVMVGPIIHNPRLIEEYSEKGVSVIDGNEIPADSLVVIRSHGISVDFQDHLKTIENVKIIDTTCPFVKRIHHLVEKKSSEGYTIIVLGDRNHSEVRAFVSRIRGKFHVINPEKVQADDFDNILRLFKENDRLFLVAQTTSRPDIFKKLMDRCLSLKDKVKDFAWENTVCDATQQRQKMASCMAENTDAMIIIGGKNSSNTAKLLEIVKKENKNAWHVESALDFSEEEVEKLKNSRIIGVTAGASTPDFQIEELRKFLEGL